MSGKSNKSKYSKLFIIAFAIATVFSATSAYAGGGSGGGGGTVGPNPLPQTAPAADIIYRESFGLADLLRPTGGKGTLKTTYLHTNIGNFWIEYPGNKNNQWLTPEGSETWRYAACSDNPYEMFSPIQVTYANGCVASEWFEVPVTNPTALMPVKFPVTAYEVSLNGYPAPLDGKYLAVGLTNSAVNNNNLNQFAGLCLVMRTTLAASYTVTYELRANGLNGTLLASGETPHYGFNQLALRYNPVTKIAGGSVNGVDLGNFPLTLATPRYAGFEGVGIADNFIVRKLQ